MAAGSSLKKNPTELSQDSGRFDSSENNGNSPRVEFKLVNADGTPLTLNDSEDDTLTQSPSSPGNSDNAAPSSYASTSELEQAA